MERGRDPQTPEISLTSLEERLDEHIASFEQEPDHSMVQRLGFDCMAVAIIFGRLIDRPTSDDIDDAILFVEEHKDMFSTPLTAMDLENSLGGYGFGIDFDRLLGRLVEQVDHYGKLKDAAPSVPAEVLAGYANLKGRVSLSTRLETLKTVVRFFNDETARSTFMSLAKEIIDNIKKANTRQQDIYLLAANGLLAAASRNFNGILAVEHGRGHLEKFNELSKLVTEINDQQTRANSYTQPGITTVNVSDKYL